MNNLISKNTLLLCLALIVLLLLSLALWLQTPDLFQYFNQAFCAH